MKRNEFHTNGNVSIEMNINVHEDFKNVNIILEYILFFPNDTPSEYINRHIIYYLIIHCGYERVECHKVI